MTNELYSLNEVIRNLGLGEGDYIFGFDYIWSRGGVVVFIAYVRGGKVAVTRKTLARDRNAVYEMWSHFNALQSLP